MALGQNIESLRQKFHLADTEGKLEEIFKNAETDVEATALAYIGASETRAAEFIFSPFTKYNYFKAGVEKIENAIKKEKNLETIYLRLLIQLNTPSFLNYNSNIESDLDYFKDQIIKSSISTDWKKKFIETLLKNNDKSVDLSELKQLKF